MDKSTTVKAAEMLPEAREWAAGVLHVKLADDDQLTLSLHPKSEDDLAVKREAARARLLGVLAKMDEKTRDVGDAEMDSAIEEALQFVRARKKQ